MDTNDLSNETYKAVLLTADKYNHNLGLQFGLLSEECIDDDDYLHKANELINEWRADITDRMEEIFFDGEKPAPADFIETLSNIQSKIQKVLKTPINKRKFEY